MATQTMTHSIEDATGRLEWRLSFPGTFDFQDEAAIETVIRALRVRAKAGSTPSLDPGNGCAAALTYILSREAECFAECSVAEAIMARCRRALGELPAQAAPSRGRNEEIVRNSPPPDPASGMRPIEVEIADCDLHDDALGRADMRTLTPCLTGRLLKAMAAAITAMLAGVEGEGDWPENIPRCNFEDAGDWVYAELAKWRERNRGAGV